MPLLPQKWQGSGRHWRLPARISRAGRWRSRLGRLERQPCDVPLVVGMMLNFRISSFLGFGSSGCPPPARMTTQGYCQCYLVGARVLEVLEQISTVRTVALDVR